MSSQIPFHEGESGDARS